MPKFNAVAKYSALGAISTMLVLTGFSTASATPNSSGGNSANSRAIVVSLDRSSLCHHKEECAVSDDDMVYQITSARRFNDTEGYSDVAIGFTITNKSRQNQEFDPLQGGFSAVLVGGGIVDSTDFEEGGDPRCYDSSTLDPNGTDPDSYVVRRGQTFRPKEMCFYPTPGVKVKSVQLQDDYAMNPVTINLKSPI
jgi:hypothetical protein